MWLSLKARNQKAHEWEIPEIPGLTLKQEAAGWRIWITNQTPVEVQHHHRINNPKAACSQDRVLYPVGIYHASEFFRTPCPDWRQLIGEIERVLTENPRMRPEAKRDRRRPQATA